LGSGSNQTTETLPMLSYRGFCPDCPAVATTSSAGGQLNFVFSGARAATLSTDVYSASQPQAHWQRGPLPIIPLSAPALRPELY
jgi:hypothetical protein